MCVTRFDQSECAICNQKEWFSRLQRFFLELYMVKFIPSLDRKISTLIPPWKVVGTLYLDSSYVTFKYFAFLRFWDKFELLGHMWKPPRWFECYFRRSSWIYCWLLLAVLSDYFGHLVSSTFPLCKFWGLHGSVPDSLPVMKRWKRLGLKRSSQPSRTTFGKRAEKTYRNGSRREASNATKCSVRSILNQNR